MDRLPVAVRLNTCIDCGRSIYGFEVRYADRFLTAPIGDLPKLIEALQKLLKLADSYNYTTNMNLPPE